MKLAFQYFTSILFIILMYLFMAFWGTVGLIPTLLSKRAAYYFLHSYCEVVMWLARVLCGLTTEVRGEVPTGSVVVAAKHQSFFDIMILFHSMDRPTFVMKKELKWAPFLGWYAMRIGSTPVNRGAKGRAVKDMVATAEKGNDESNQLAIYPQGTRVPPGKKMPYKVGAAVLAERMNRPIHMAACNVGVFWPKRSLLRKPGVAVVEYIGIVPDGLSVEEITKHLEAHIEPASERLMIEAGWTPPKA